MHDIVIRIGADFVATFRVVDADGVAVDLTGATFTAKAARKPGGTAIATFSTAIVSAAAGTFKITLDAATTATLKPGPAYYDVLITQGGVTLPWDEQSSIGNVLIKQGVS